MTKLLEWLSLTAAGMAVWYSLVFGYVKHKVIDDNMDFIIVLPAICLVMFVVFSVINVLHRTLSFNDCEAAASELQEEILEAKKELEDKLK